MESFKLAFSLETVRVPEDDANLSEHDLWTINEIATKVGSNKILSLIADGKVPCEIINKYCDLRYLKICLPQDPDQIKTELRKLFR